ncbi:MAG TPA: malectin domain-containing carbohydrate-binding protein [Planctomycetaceae bacterium]|nr:malectin domain-containing carbohydrate-binding protein [Planctomycetaceae bacterium]
MLSRPFESFLNRLNDRPKRRHKLRRARRRIGGHATVRPSNWGCAAETLEDRTLLSGVVTWTGGAGTTNWATAANWSTNAVPGSGDDVVINVATNTTIQISSANVSVNSITTNAQLSVNSTAKLAAGTLNASANVLLQGGTIANTIINMAPGSALLGSYPGGTLDGVTASGLLDMSNARLGITDGLTLNNATMLLGDTNGTTFGDLWFTNTETLGGTGTIIVGNQSPPFTSNQTNTFGLVNPSLTVTIGAGITIRGNSATFEAYNNGSFQNPGSFINQGTIAADASVAPGNFAYDTGYNGGSTGTQATPIDTSAVTNPAPQQVYQSLRYGPGFGYTLSGLTAGASYTVRLHFASLFNIGVGTQAFNVSINGSQVLTNFDVLAAAGGLNKATVQQFTAVANANGQILLNFASTKYEAQINGIEVLSGSTQVQTVAAGAELGGITFGVVQDNLPPVFINDGTLAAANGETLAINGPWTNAAGATINSSGATLNLGDPAGYYDAWSNAGTINVNGSTLNLGGSFTSAGLGTLNESANTINLIGKFDNTSATLALTAATGSWNLFGGAIKNGTLAETGGAELVFTPSGGTIDGLTVNGNLDLTSGTASVLDGLVLKGTAFLGNLVGSTGGILYFNNTETLSGNGTVIFGGSSGNAIYGGSSTVTIGSGITIRGSAGTFGATPLINQGTIIAEVTSSYGSDTFYLDDVINEGTIEVTSGEVLNFNSCTNTAGATITATDAWLDLWRLFTNEAGGLITATNGCNVMLGDQGSGSLNNWSNAGTINVTDSTLNLGGLFTLAAMGTINQTRDTVNLTGILDNTGTTLALNATTGSWYFLNGVIRNGTLTETDGAELIFNQGTLDGVTVDGILDLTGNLIAKQARTEISALVLDALVLNGTAYLGDAAGSFYGTLDFGTAGFVPTNQTLSGTGTIVFGKHGALGSGNLNFPDRPGTVTIGPGITIHGNAGTIDGPNSVGPFTDQGTIVVDDDGSSAALGSFVYDRLYSGNWGLEATTAPIDTSGVTNPAPQAVYQTSREGTFTYTLPNLTPGGAYTVRLDFAEFDATAAGQRLMNVIINGTQVLTSFDIFATAGAKNKAVAETFAATASAQGQIVINFNGISRVSYPAATVNGIELYSGNTQLLAIDVGGSSSNGFGLPPLGNTNSTTTTLYLNDPGSLSTPKGAYVSINGSMLGNTQNASQYQMVGTLTVAGGTATTPTLFEAMSNDLGATPAGFINNFADGTLEIATGGYHELVDQSRNSGSTQPEAVYAYDLVVEPGATLNLKGLHLYVGSEQVAGTIVGGTVTVVTLPAPVVTAPATAAVNVNRSLAFAGRNAISVSDASGIAEQLTLTTNHGTLNLSETSGVTVSGNGNGLVVITGQIASVNSTVSSLVYTPASGYAGPDVLSLSDTDLADGLTGLASVALRVNGPPIINTPTTASLYENGSYTFSSSIAVVDASASGPSESLAIQVSHGTLTLASTTGLTFSSGSNGSASMTVTGTLASVNAALNGLLYRPATGYSGSDTLSISVTDTGDNLSGSTGVALTIIIVPPPTISAPASETLNQNTSLVFSSGNNDAITVADAGPGANADSLTLTVADGTVTLPTTSGLTVTAGANGSSSITVTGSIANLNTALNGLIYKPMIGYSGFDALAMSVGDSVDGLSTAGSVALTINNPPAITAPATASVLVTASLTFSTANKNAISIADVSAGAAVEPLTLRATNGMLTLGSTSGITVTSGSNSSAYMTISGTLANLNNALSGLIFKPAVATSATVVLAYTDVATGLSATSTTNITLIKSPLKLGPTATVGPAGGGPVTFAATPASSGGTLDDNPPPPDTQLAGFAAAVHVLAG